MPVRRPTLLDLSLRQLEYVVAVATHLGFRRAAEACHVSQPSLSAQVMQLEQALGVRLFERDRRRVRLTAAGEELLVRARRVISAATDLVDASVRLADPLAGPLRLGVIPTIAPYVLPTLVPAIVRAHPRLQLLIREERTAAVVRELHAGTLDAALLARGSELAGLAQERVAEDAFVLATPRNHPLARQRTVAVEDLAGHDVFLLEDGHCFRDQVLPLCARAGAQEIGFRGTSLSTLAQMVGAGAGVTLLPGLAVATENRGKQLAIRPFRGARPGRQLVIAFRAGGAREPAIHAVAAVVRAAWPRSRSPEASG
jgi:LysR family transcriptional regulator, hydrogen peroxide-inducible genes activator